MLSLNLRRGVVDSYLNYWAENRKTPSPGNMGILQEDS